LIPIEEEENDNTKTMNKGKEIILEESLENHPDISDFTPKTGARWASVKSPTSHLPFKKNNEIFLQPSSSLSSNLEQYDTSDDILD